MYGQEKLRADALRLREDGRLRADAEHGLPDALEVELGVQGARAENKAAGDERVNETPALVALSGLFVLNHNWHAAQLKELYGALSDDQLYEEARRRNIAEYQHIVFDEWLPSLLGVDV